MMEKPFCFLALLLVSVARTSWASCPNLEPGRGVELTCRYGDEPVSCEEVDVDTVARFTCREPYVPNAGSTERTCLSDGTWSGGGNLECKAECGRITSPFTPTIINGRPASIGIFPWHAAMYLGSTDREKLFCGGSLIEEDIILTAAHCLAASRTTDLIDLSTMQIVFGNQYSQADNASGLEQTKKAIRAVIHPEYEPRTYKNDVALLQLDSPVDINEYVSTVCGPHRHSHTDEHLQKGVEGLVAGFGLTENHTNSYNLLMASLPVVPDDECRQEIPVYLRSMFREISPSRYCAGFGRAKTVVTEFCPAGWEEFGNNCYHISHDKVTWTEARDKCKEHTGGDLVSLHSEEELKVLTKNFRRYMWIGLHSPVEEDVWEWSDGTPVKYEKWGEGEPNNLDDERCVEVVLDYNHGAEDSAYFNTRNCGQRRPFICHLHASAGKCPDEWEKEGNYCYYASDFQATWRAARDHCKSVNPYADLASVHSEDDLKVLIDKMSVRVWIGLHSMSEEGVWEWSDSTDADFLKWAEGQPDNLEMERCGELQHKLRFGPLGGDFSNGDCSVDLPYACKISKVQNVTVQGPRGETNICRGDSGGGMVFVEASPDGNNDKWYLEGIVNSGVNVPNMALPCYTAVAFFTRVDHFSEWIQDVLSDLQYTEE